MQKLQCEKISVFEIWPLKSHPAHFSMHIQKVSVSQLAEALSVCMLPIRSKIFPVYDPVLCSGPQRIWSKEQFSSLSFQFFFFFFFSCWLPELFAEFWLSQIEEFLNLNPLGSNNSTGTNQMRCWRFVALERVFGKSGS